MTNVKRFGCDFVAEYEKCLSNYHRDNFDYYVLKGHSFRQEVFAWVSYYLYKCLKLDLVYISRWKVVEAYECLYGLLADDKSRELLIKLLCYRLLGYRRVKLPLSESAYWSQMRAIHTAISEENPTILTQPGSRLQFYDLRAFGVPIKVYSMPFGVYTLFVAGQYQYSGADDTVGCNAGDYVIDAGACWGETALEFARRTGASGRVFAFEFVPSNLTILERNLALNPDLMPIITLVPAPVWDSPGQEFAFDDGGCSSRLSEERAASRTVRTTSIDEYVREHQIDRIDYIKMDIEGAELAALRGAIQVLKSSRPKLAIALYHRVEDFRTIPEFIHGLDLGYRFHLGHHSINEYETILYATAR